MRRIGLLFSAGNAVIMNYVHQVPGWPAFTWDAAILEQTLASVRCRQGRLLGQMTAQGFQLQAESGLKNLAAEIVQSSAIEGEHLDQEQVRSSIARHLGMEAGGLAPVSRYVDGLVEMMLDATRQCDKPLTEARLFGWHTALFPMGRSGMRDITVGAWRTGPMHVVSGRLGREKIHFEAPTADRVSREMASFLQWFNSSQALDPVLKAAMAHLWFVTVHPFDDGNGRMARAISEMALSRADQTTERFYSMSSQIEAERKRYYELLESTQKGTLDITRWMLWFVECLDRTIARAEETLHSVLRKAQIWERANQGMVNDRQRKVMNRLLDDFKGELNTSKYSKIAKCSTDTALRDIRELLERGVLEKNRAGGRSTSYRLAGGRA